MASTIRVSYFNGGSDTPGAGVTAEGGLKFNRANTLTGTTAIPIPTAAGTNYSWPKFLGLEVTVDGTTTISNRKVNHAAGIATGMEVFFKGTATYNTPDGTDITDNTTTDDANPAGYTAMSTVAQTYDAASAASALGLNGQYCVVALGVSSTYAGGAGTNQAVPTLTFTYDES